MVQCVKLKNFSVTQILRETTFNVIFTYFSGRGQICPSDPKTSKIGNVQGSSLQNTVRLQHRGTKLKHRFQRLKLDHGGYHCQLGSRPYLYHANMQFQWSGHFSSWNWRPAHAKGTYLAHSVEKRENYSLIFLKKIFREINSSLVKPVLSCEGVNFCHFSTV